MRYLWVNFKTYQEATGAAALALAKLLDAKKDSVQIILSVQNADIRRISSEVSCMVFAQHVDAVAHGAHTGAQLAEALAANGAAGCVISHAEDRIPDELIAACIARCREAGLRALVCVDTADAAERIAALNPDFIVIEPPDLIGTTTSVSQSRPELIREAVARVKRIVPLPVLCGAGISTKEDVGRALELGCNGVGIAKALVTAPQPAEKLNELLSAFK